MHVTEERVPVKMTAPGAVARQLPGFGDAAGYAGISGEVIDHMAHELAAMSS